MANKYVFNPFTGTFDLINSSSGVSVTEVTSDPASPAGQLWVLRTNTGATVAGKLKAFGGFGFPIVSITSSGSNIYQLSFGTSLNGTKRVSIL